MEVFCGLRGFPVRYLIFVEPWLYLALALLIEEMIQRRLPALRLRDRKAMTLAGMLGVAFAATLFVNIGQSLDSRMQTKQLLSGNCYVGKVYLHRLPGYFDKYCD